MSVRTIYDRKTCKIVAVMQVPRRAVDKLAAKYPEDRYGMIAGRPPAGHSRVIDGEYAPDESGTQADKADAARSLRDRLLKDSDFALLDDAPVDQKAWRAYRQGLRDITKQAGFPDDIKWPKKPE